MAPSAYKPGDAFMVKVNSHRSMWSGSVCSNPKEWECGGSAEFRAAYCAQGDGRCFHINIFNPAAPKFYTGDPNLVAFFEANPQCLNDQLLFFSGSEFDRNKGRKKYESDPKVYGFYRVKRAELLRMGQSYQLAVEPYADGWAVFPHNAIAKPSTSKAFESTSYLQRLSAGAAQNLIANAAAAGHSAAPALLSNELKKRLKGVADNIEKWGREARAHAEKIEFVLPAPQVSAYESESSRRQIMLKSEPMSQLAEKLSALDVAPKTTQIEVALPKSNPPPAPSACAIPSQDAGANQVQDAQNTTPVLGRRALPEAGMLAGIEADYGKDTAMAIRVATLSKSLLLLAGPTGVGKSTLATRLIDDPERKRTLLVAVPATWRGRDDLLGYINPVSGEFEPTAFCEFLRRAAKAWKEGNRENWLVVFEEFNLSQPEHWFSDILVRMEYDHAVESDRTIDLGGRCFAGEDGNERPSIFLPPTLSFVATMNNDHTVRPLSPRVLDRSALVEIAGTSDEALLRAGVDLSEPIRQVIGSLDDLLQPRGITFSVRSAKSLQSGVAEFGTEKTVQILDYVLVQEVLSKVRLTPAMPNDEKLLTALKGWSELPACVSLVRSRERIAQWAEAIASGQDVIQA